MITEVIHIQIKGLHPYLLPDLGTEPRRELSPPFRKGTTGHWHHHRSPSALSESLDEEGLPKKDCPLFQLLSLYETHTLDLYTPSDRYSLR